MIVCNITLRLGQIVLMMMIHICLEKHRKYSYYLTTQFISYCHLIPHVQKKRSYHDIMIWFNGSLQLPASRSPMYMNNMLFINMSRI